MNYYRMNIKQTEDKFKTNKELGLTNKEAIERLTKNGANTIKAGKKKSPTKRFFAQFNDFMVMVLLGASLVSFIGSIIKGNYEFFDSIIILIIVFLNALLGFFQENKAEKSLEALKKLSTPKAVVIRNGIVEKIDKDNLVIGDLIYINSGDYVCADARLVESIDLQMDESSLTGESSPVTKFTKSIQDGEKAIGDRLNMVYSSSLAILGRGKAIVVATGMDTEIGKIASMLMTQEPTKTNLQKKLEETGKILGVGAIIICTIIFFIGVIKGASPFDMFMTSISLAVAAIPEGLPAIVTIMLAIGVQKMAVKNVIVRKLQAVEELGSATVICTDKTGTLTQNKMKVVNVISENKKLVYKYLAVSNNVTLGKDNVLIGEPTEVALLELSMQNMIYKKDIEKLLPRIDEFSFSSKRKMMSTIHKNKNMYEVITKGAIDKILNICTHCYDNGDIVEINEDKIKSILNDNAKMAKDALRVIGICYKKINSYNDLNKINAESNLIFLGLIGIIDPPRPEVFEAVSMCKKACVKPIMITGDHIETAKAIAKKVGILTNDKNAITGDMLTNMNKKEIIKYEVFARVSPKDKVTIVNAFKKSGNIVAMTGDGVNDAPALKASNIGCSMGIMGTDVAKEASDIILADDNFATIVEGIKEGRIIYENIKKSVHFLLSSNIGEIIAILFALLIGFDTPLMPIQLLWINLVTDSLPAIALGVDKVNTNIMRGRSPKSKTGIFTRARWSRILLEGLMIGSITILAYAIGKVYFGDIKIGTTMAFATLSISQLVHAFNIKSEKSIFKINVFNNVYLILALIIGVLLQMSVIMIPIFADIFKVVPLSTESIIIVFGLCLLPIFIVEVEKLLINKNIK